MSLVTCKSSIHLGSQYWKDYSLLAMEYWRNYEFEKTARTCLAFLKGRLENKSNAENSNKDYTSSLQIIITCGGSGERWGHFMGMSKQLIDTGYGVPLVQRTINQFARQFKQVPIAVLIGQEQRDAFSGIRNCDFIFREMSTSDSLYLEVIAHQARNKFKEKEILWICGDVCFSDGAVDQIGKTVSTASKMKIFGRKNINLLYGNNGGEDFGWYIPSGDILILEKWYLLALRLYTGTPMYRHSSWEVISLMSLAYQQGISSPDAFQALPLSPADAWMAMQEIFNSRKFGKDLWVEIDDSTEDFDYPIEYLNRLMLMVERVGMGDWQ
ncbi:MAG: hypothetical protein ACOYLI_01240 [Synechococcus lacustris]